MNVSGLEDHSTSNKKVKNATPLDYDSISFKSKLEMYCYKLLKEKNIPVEYENVKFQILPSFSYNNEKIRFSAIQAATAYGLIYSIHSVILDSQLKNTFIKQENIPCVSLNHFKY